ncbi:MAG: hypothetical protein Q8Q73_01085 [Stagnimonas sp.]|nr:hypothetical protein [Stagnimonas sp.]
MTDLSPLPSDNLSSDVFEQLPPASWRRLDDLALIRARGAEARGFLQAQLSNDVARISVTQAQLSGYCGPKGRALAVFTVAQLESADSLGLELPAELLAPTLKRLRMFVLRSKLVLDDASAEWPALGLAGSQAAELLTRLNLSVPTVALGTAMTEGALVLRRPGVWPRYVLRAAPERLALIVQALAALPELPVQDWARAELLAGMPQVRAATVDHFVPQTIDLDLAGGISFSKGCYPGQEIVARVHYLGRLKQRLHLAECAEAAEPGQAVLLAGGDGQAVGEVMDCAPGVDGGYLIALTLRLDQADSTGLRLERPEGALLAGVRAAPH